MSELNEIYGDGMHMPNSSLAEVGDLPDASYAPDSQPNLISALPAGQTLAVSPVNPAASFGAALAMPGFPAYVIPPPVPAFSVRSVQTSISVKVGAYTGARHRLRNRLVNFDSGWLDSLSETAIALSSNRWNLVEIEFEGGSATLLRSLDINITHTNQGSLVLHYKGAPPILGFIGGGPKILDIEVDATFGPSYFDISTRSVAAEVIDRLLIAGDQNGRLNGTFKYSLNPGSPDSTRSEKGLQALNNLLNKGWTITR